MNWTAGIVALLCLSLPQAGKAPAFSKEAPILKKIEERVRSEGQDGVAEKTVDTFLNMKGAKVKWHSQYDLERQVLIYRDPASGQPRIAFLVPEKPFPEFGKTWVYCLSLKGDLIRAGVQDLRSPFRALKDEVARPQCLKEIRHWDGYFKDKG